MYFERSKHGSERGLYKPTAEIQQGGIFLLYTTYGSGTCSCRINGTVYSATVSSSQKITNAGIDLFSKTLDIYHNADGSKYLEASAWISMNTPLSSSEQGFGAWLSTIPRASSISGINGNTFGSPVIVSISRASDSFYHTVIYERPDGNQITVGTSIGTSCTFMPHINDCNYVTNSTAGTAKIIVHTYSGSTYIGTASSAFTIYVPSSVVPTISSVALTEEISEIESQFNGYIQGKSKISGTVSASGAYGSTIKAYSISINGGNYTNSNFTTDFLTTSGNNSCSVTVTDTRNRTASETVSFSVIPYFSPSTDYDSAIESTSEFSVLDKSIKEVQSLLDEFSDENFLEKIKSVDGAGSGIDADLLDGKHGSEYATIEQFNSTVPQSRTINSKPLSSDIELTHDDVGAAKIKHTHAASDITSGTLSIENGGTGATSVTGAQSALKIFTDVSQLNVDYPCTTFSLAVTLLS